MNKDTALVHKLKTNLNILVLRIVQYPLIRAGLIERTGDTEPSLVPTAKDRVYLRLSSKGIEAEDRDWVEADHGGG